MDTNNDDVKKDVPAPEVKKDGPPPPDIKKGPPAPPVPSMVTGGKSGASGAPTTGTGLNVKIKAGDGGAEEDGPREDDNRAGLGERVGGFLIDVLVCVGIGAVLTKIIPFNFLDRVADLAAIAYLLTRDSLPFLKGQSLGKKAVGIRVETLDGNGISENWQAGLVRNAALIVPPFWVVELVVLLTREDKPEAGMRLGDEWAKTRVVKVAKVAADTEGEAGDEAVSHAKSDAAEEA